MKTIELQKKNAVGNLQFWKAEINGNKVTVTWGVLNGKTQVKTTVFKKTKNEGRSNAKTPEDVCLFDTEVKARHKIEKGYKLIKGKLETTSDTVKTSDLNIPNAMLAKKYGDHSKKVAEYDKIYVQPKLDGIRMLFNLKTGKMYSRTRKEIVSVPHLSYQIIKACEILKAAGIEWIDGELFSDAISFEKIQSIIGKSKNVDLEQAKTIKYNIFDYISNEAWTTRWARLWLSLNAKQNEYIKLVQACEIKVKDIQKYHDDFVAQGHEGIIIRLPDFAYEQKRSTALLKHKCFIDEEFKIIGVESEKNNADKLGAMIMQTKDGKKFKARPKTTEEEKEYIFNNQRKYIGKMGTVKYQGLSEDGIPRFPVFLHTREKWDK